LVAWSIDHDRHLFEIRKDGERKTLGMIVVVMGVQECDCRSPSLEKVIGEWEQASPRVYNQPLAGG
jgi:hypothetical protein